ncbi:MAG: hypothetical protein M0Z30_07805 [Actinomycetota bacterium]|nr:hypothetical protein [Actinomycetota bacterium]
MAVAHEEIEPGRLVSAIHDLLIRYGYPPDRVTDWWTEATWSALGGRTPRQAWDNHEYEKVWKTISDAYAATAKAGERLARDQRHQAILDARIAELKHRNGL